MTHRMLSAVMAAGALIATSTALADTMQPSGAATASNAKLAKKTTDGRIDDQEIVCRREDSTGTRLGAKKVCHTRGEWAAMAADARQEVNRIQTTPQTH